MSPDRDLIDPDPKVRLDNLEQIKRLLDPRVREAQILRALAGVGAVLSL
jgi:hypothetical protein